MFSDIFRKTGDFKKIISYIPLLIINIVAMDIYILPKDTSMVATTGYKLSITGNIIAVNN
jgi:hypothetical protein